MSVSNTTKRVKEIRRNTRRKFSSAEYCRRVTRECLEWLSRRCLFAFSSSFLFRVTMSQISLLFKTPSLSDYRWRGTVHHKTAQSLFQISLSA